MKSPPNKDKNKAPTKKIDPAILTALITGIVTIIAGALASPVLIALINKTPAPTLQPILPPTLAATFTASPPPATPTNTPTATLEPTPTRLAGPCPFANMVLVPEGEFVMGAPKNDASAKDDAKPQQEILLSTFCIDKYEVSNANYALVVKDHPYNEETAKLPVVDITWDAANHFCEALGKELPTEAQWEKAARWTDGRNFPWGNTWQPEYANSGEAKIPRLVPVDSFPDVPTAYGILNMAGNAAEWVFDWYVPDWYSLMPTVDPLQSTEPVDTPYKVVRGGSYVDATSLLRTFERDGTNSPQDSASYIGFRCATTHVNP
jgi:hypothetical protein